LSLLRVKTASWATFASVLLSSLVIVSCQPGPAARADVGRSAEAATPIAQNPAIVYTVETPTILSPPAFTLLRPEDLDATAAARETEAAATSTPSPTASATPIPSPTTTPTATPLPTFTPPALPLTSANEHYWLRRPVADGGVVWTDKSYPYGHTRGGSLRPHHGVEFNVPRNTEILAAASGTVVVAGSDAATAYGPQLDFYGNLLVIELDSQLGGQPVYNLYGHLSEILVSEGQHVGTLEPIALSGASGVADGPHLHFEVRVGENSYDHTRNPLLWLYPFPDRGTVAGLVVWPDGQVVHEAPISLRRIDAPSRYAVTTTYAAFGVNSDDMWGENFAFDDVEAGFYEVLVSAGQHEFREEVWVFPYRTSFVEFTLNAAARSSDQ